MPMQMHSMANPFIAFLWVLLITPAVVCHATETVMDFDYKGAKGPQHWGELKEEWKACSEGQRQSPIDLVRRGVQIYPHLGKLQRNYRSANASLKNRGHDLMVKWEGGAGSIHIDGANYRLIQCHWHSPAEHTLNATRYPLEIHMVHQSEDNHTAVVGILYKYGRPDTFLTELMGEIASMGHIMEPGAEEAVGIVNPMHVKFGSRKYYRYNGSLTTPPCTEGVTWIIVKKVRTVSKEQVRELIMTVHDGFGKNARPRQRANGRVVQLYNPRRLQSHS